MTSLTKQQQELVAQNLPVVHWVICDYIHVNPTICGLEYSDLFQEGCVWLCKAAATFKDSAGSLLESMGNWPLMARSWRRSPTYLTLRCP